LAKGGVTFPPFIKGDEGDYKFSSFDVDRSVLMDYEESKMVNN
jgi:hypothetical protein